MKLLGHGTVRAAMATDWFDGRLAQAERPDPALGRCSIRSRTSCSCCTVMIVLVGEGVFTAWIVAADRRA